MPFTAAGTADGTSEERKRYLEAGMKDVVARSVEPEAPYRTLAPRLRR